MNKVQVKGYSHTAEFEAFPASEYMYHVSIRNGTNQEILKSIADFRDPFPEILDNILDGGYFTVNKITGMSKGETRELLETGLNKIRDRREIIIEKNGYHIRIQPAGGDVYAVEVLEGEKTVDFRVITYDTEKARILKTEPVLNNGNSNGFLKRRKLDSLVREAMGEIGI